MARLDRSKKGRERIDSSRKSSVDNAWSTFGRGGDGSHAGRQLTIAAFMNKGGNGRWGKVTGNEPVQDDDHALHPSP